MSSRDIQRSKLEELKALRTSKKTRLSTFRTQDAAKIFDEFDEEEYKQVQRARLDEDDFVVDDNGEGYVENGVEEWGRERETHEGTSSEEDVDSSHTVNRGKRKRESEKIARREQDGSINKYFTSIAMQPVSKLKAQATVEDQSFLNSLLGQLDDTQDDIRNSKKPKSQLKSDHLPSFKRALSPSRDTSFRKVTTLNEKRLNTNTASSLSSSPPKLIKHEAESEVNHVFDLQDEDLDDLNPHQNDTSQGQPVSTGAGSDLNSRYEDEDEDEDLAIRPILKYSKSSDLPVNLDSTKPDKALLKSDRHLNKPSVTNEIDYAQWRDINESLSLVDNKITSGTTLSAKINSKDALEQDGSLLFFWMDYTEIAGCLCLFGKIRTKGSRQYASAFLKVNGIMRKLYFLPRDHRKGDEDSPDSEVEMSNVYNEVDTLLSKHQITNWKAKPCFRKYAFELSDIPRESDYLKVLYPYDKPQLPFGIEGSTYSHIFGTGTSIFEQFVLARNVMGPCWLRVNDCKFTGVENASWCKLELQTDSPSNITPATDSDGIEPPPLRLMSIAMRTKINSRDNKQEIFAISGRIYDSVSLNDTTPAEMLQSNCFTIVRPTSTMFPTGFEKEVKQHKGVIETEKTEAGLLSSFLAKVQACDPDAFIGHQLEEGLYGTLIHRLKENKVLNWHRIGRLRRSQWPNNLGRGGYFVERQMVAGRLICDLANDLGKSLMNKCQSWSLTEMCDLILERRRTELDNETSLKTWASTGSGFLHYLEHCETDTFMIAAIALKIQMLPLAKQLTNLAGNSWARTMSGTRAERNEYILLHEFTKNKFVCPDKIYDKGKGNQIKIVDEDGGGEEEETPQEGKKKDKFKGGLVLEPEKGLYDKFVLVMDFNSLYPSIIQEYNICFTTVERSELAEDKVPDVPIEQSLGVLPRLISTLVQRRRQVKALMKDKNATEAQLSQWDIKQQALKLTANSMYGCLGYTRSRFYARPLAMLTTFQGREILRSTKELADSLQLRVIYGDTDSVMINTNFDNYADAIKVGNDFKKSVNERYRLLEIDIDNVFQRLLLHSKKKYAALNYAADGKTIVEVKGLDMRRREYCQISKDISNSILKELLSGEEQDVVIEKIHDLLRDLASQVRENRIDVHKYTIYTKLSKDPEHYPGGNHMPQVQVALRRKGQGEVVKSNDVIAYIITGDSGSSTSPAERAFSPQEMKIHTALKPDAEWYLVKQIFPPIERLCGPIDGTNSMRLAECLGLDTRKYQIAASIQVDQEFYSLESTLTDEERFAEVDSLILSCLRCAHSFSFVGLSSEICTSNGLQCSSPGCKAIFSAAALVAQVDSAIRTHTTKYYEAWLRCDDNSCGNRTRQMSVYGKRCLGPQGLGKDCLGTISYEYTDKMLYTQLLYYQTIFDVDKAKAKVDITSKENLIILAEQYRQQFGVIEQVISTYLKKCGRSWVQMDAIFSFA